jgi:hypothetical protein
MDWFWIILGTIVVISTIYTIFEIISLIKFYRKGKEIGKIRKEDLTGMDCGGNELVK